MKTSSSSLSQFNQLSRFYGDSVQSTILPMDVLSLIFSQIKDINLKNIHTISLVCSEWKQIKESSSFWKNIFLQASIPLPLNPEANLHQAFAYKTGFLFANKVRACKEPCFEEIEIKIDFSKYHKVQFIEDSFVIAYAGKTIFISPIETGVLPKKITLDSAIYSMCSVQKMIYCSLVDGQIIAFSMDNETEIFSIKDKDPSAEDLEEIDILANEKWIIGVSYDEITKWDRNSREISSISNEKLEQIEYAQIDCNKLYYTTFLEDVGRELHCLDLDGGEEPIFVRDLESKITHLKIHGNKGSYIQEESLFSSDSSDSSDSTESSDDQPLIISFPLDSIEEEDNYKQKTLGVHSDPHLLFFGDLVIVARDGYDPEKIYGDVIEIEDPEILELIDLKSKKTLHLIQKDSINVIDDMWPIGVFENKILYVTNKNKVVKVTFS